MDRYDRADLLRGLTFVTHMLSHMSTSRNVGVFMSPRAVNTLIQYTGGATPGVGISSTLNEYLKLYKFGLELRKMWKL